MATINWYDNKYGNQYDIDLQCIYPSQTENAIFCVEKWHTLNNAQEAGSLEWSVYSIYPL